MTKFIFIAIVILLVVVAALLLPLTRGARGASINRRQANIDFAKQRLIELKTQRTEGDVSEDHFIALRNELEETIAAEVTDDAISADDAVKAPIPMVAVVFIAITVPLLTLALYLKLGEPQLLTANKGNPSMSAEQNVISQLEAKLDSDPNDVEGLDLLSRSYMQLGRYGDAIKATLRLIELDGETADRYSRLADAAALEAGGNLAGAPSDYLEKALALDANEASALWLSGLAAAQQGNQQVAVAYWQRLLPLLSNAPEQQMQLSNLIAQAQKSQQTTGTGEIKISLAIDEQLASQLEEDLTVFVIARSQPGMPPLAVKRLEMSALPTTISLSDADAMLPSRLLSSESRIEVIARLSLSGQAMAQSGDFESDLVVVSEQRSAELIISKRID